MKKAGEGSKEREKELAWMGDAVLALFTRRWILDTFGRTDGALQTLVTSNRFLSRFGVPTAVEAMIGAELEARGMDAALELVRDRFLPDMIKQVRKHHPDWTGYLKG